MTEVHRFIDPEGDSDRLVLGRGTRLQEVKDSGEWLAVDPDMLREVQP